MDLCDDQSETIAFLAGSQGLGAAGPVERVDTHAAIVFLTETRAYKLKRAVRYPYLDFSSAAKRRAVCEAELALNRRTAPDLYLGVDCVGREAGGRLALGRGEPVDWLVVMRRFPSDCLLDAMARKGPLSPGLMRDLADEIATFHAAAEVVSGFGADRVKAVIDGNRASMDALPAGLLAPDQCERLHRRSLAVLGELAALLDQRAASGRVRHCHGDLHLANICLWNGRPTLFDCLEFDSGLATTDVLYDLAFLVMDLWQRDLHAGASLVFNRYCDMHPQGSGLAAMGLFLSMRAAVRAHVHASASARQTAPEQRDAEVGHARAYLAAALAMLDRHAPRLIAIGGLSGSGKSTLAGSLAPLVGDPPGARWLRTDVLRKRLAGVHPEAPLPPQAYTAERNRQIYRALIDEASEALAAGMSVIVDGVFADPAERSAIAQVTAGSGAPFHGLWLDAPFEVLCTRVNTRQGDASDADAAVVERQLGYDLGDLGDWQRLRAQGSRENVLAQARALVEGTIP